MRSASWSFVTLALVAGTVEGARSPEASRPPAVCFAPGTDPEYVARTYASVGAHISLAPQPESFQFNLANRWGGASLQGQPIVLTWSVIPDGTSIPAAGIPGEVTSPSNLRARLDAIYGSQAVWQPIFQQMFDAWGALTGTSYQFVNDDGAAFPGSSSGVRPARGDVRIGGHHLDGDFSVLAYNYFPEHRRHGDRHQRLVLHEHGQRLAGPAQRPRSRARPRARHQSCLPGQPDEADGALPDHGLLGPAARRRPSRAARLRRQPRERRLHGHRHRLRNGGERHLHVERREPGRQRGRRLRPLHGAGRQAAGCDPDADRLHATTRGRRTRQPEPATFRRRLSTPSCRTTWACRCSRPTGRPCWRPRTASRRDSPRRSPRSTSPPPASTSSACSAAAPTRSSSTTCRSRSNQAGGRSSSWGTPRRPRATRARAQRCSPLP